MHSAISHHHLTKAQPVPEQQPPNSFAPSLYTGHNTIQSGMSLWPRGRDCPCCVPSQLPVPPSHIAGGVV